MINNLKSYQNKITRSSGIGKITLLILMLFITYLSSIAQTNCSQNFKAAEKKFESGNLWEVPVLMSECMINKKFSTEELLKAYKLLTLTYLYLDDSLNAEITFYNLLKDFPDFQVNKTVDPAELVDLFQSYKTLPLFSFGFQTGTSITHISPTVLYGIDNVSKRTENYQPLIGYTAGLRFDVPLSKRIFITTGSSFSVFRYKNTRQLFTTNLLYENGSSHNFAEVYFAENQSWINIPLAIGATLGNNRVKHYVYGGASAGYLLSAQANASRKFNNPLGSGSELKGPVINVLDLRKNFNYWGLIGAGIKIKSGLNHINIEVQYDIGLSNIVNGAKRYSNSHLFNRYGYIDNDIRMNFFTLKGSYMITRYKPKKVNK